MLSQQSHQRDDQKSHTNHQESRFNTDPIWVQLVAWVVDTTANDSNVAGGKITIQEQYSSSETEVGKRRLRTSHNIVSSKNGYIHPNLILKSITINTSYDNDDDKKGQKICAKSSTGTRFNPYASADSLDANASRCRGIFFEASKDDTNNSCCVEAGEVLLRIPRNKTIHGQRFPAYYDKEINDSTLNNLLSEKNDSNIYQTNNNENDEQQTQLQQKVFVSTWLRCLAAYYDAYSCSILPSISTSINENAFQFNAYFQSLPSSYETISSWTKDEIDEYLSGTTLPHPFVPTETLSVVGEKNSNEDANTDMSAEAAPSVCEWKTDPNLIKNRYMNHIRSYLLKVVPSFSHLVTYLYEQQSSALTELDVELEFFALSCQVMSTRAFHMNDADGTMIFNYTGPYLFPVIDLLNHTSDPNLKNTSLRCIRRNDSNFYMEKQTKRRLESNSQISQLLPSNGSTHKILSNDDKCIFSLDGNANTIENGNKVDNEMQNDEIDFVMIAERKIHDGEEILHSYGDHLSPHEFLQTFGFVPETFIVRAAYGNCTENDTESLSRRTSSRSSYESASSSLFMQVTKTELLQSCWDIINSGTAKFIQQSLFQIDETIEVWTLQSDPITQQQRTSKVMSMKHIPDIITIHANPMISYDQLLFASPSTQSKQQNRKQQQEKMMSSAAKFSVLTDDLVTICCLPFLPVEAYDEVNSNEVLDQSILQDTYLGTLVATALLNLLHTKLSQFQPISNSALQQLCIPIVDDDISSDMEFNTGYVQTKLSTEYKRVQFHKPITKDCTNFNDVLILRNLVDTLSINHKREDFGTIAKSNKDTLTADQTATYEDNVAKLKSEAHHASKLKETLCTKYSSNNSNTTSRTIKQLRLAYGLTIRIDQRQVLLQVYDEIIQFLNSLQ